MLRKAFILSLLATVVFACSWDYSIWIPRDPSADPLYRFIKDGKAGYIDHTGRVIVPAELRSWGNSGSEFHDGLLETSVSDGKYIDRSGKVVIDGLYRGWDFSEGLAVAMKKGEGLWGYIDTSGKFAISPRFETYPNGYVYSFSDGLAAIEVHGKFGFIDRSGQFVINPSFPDADSFRDGAARVVTEGPCAYVPDGPCPDFKSVSGTGSGQATLCKFTYIDKAGRVIGQLHFDFGRNFSEGLAPVKMGTQWGFIDKSGSVVVPFSFEDAEPHSSGLARIRKSGLYGYVDKVGAVVIPARYKYAESFSDGFAVVGDGGDTVWYIDRGGKVAFPEKFSSASPFFKGLANVRILRRETEQGSDLFAYIDTQGRRVFTY